MNREEARKTVEATFNNPFDEERFRIFINNLLPNIDLSKEFTRSGQIVPKSYSDYITHYKRLGKYTDIKGNELDVLIVPLKNPSSLDRARTMQRNFISWYLKEHGGKDYALVSYYHNDLEDWRFSFVKMEYKWEETEGGKIKVEEELTPARRFSFLVGKNEPNHTAQQYLVPLLEKKESVLIVDIEKAFNVESVTREFFTKYRELFLELKDELDKLVEQDNRIKKDFTDKNIDTENFAKKLLGQIVFLYFLQKKGWLGVGKDENSNFKKWGEGVKDFLRRLFNKENYKNFFNDILEPLFYEALATKRDDDYYSHFDCKIPFLNGGLFEPINNYDWVNTYINIPDEIFSNTIRTKQGDIGTGILDVFERYNFTVKEDEPLDKEVAVDPEMLGKVFENLLEVKDRKSKGTYYTPREIVHYMCRESLINYLDSALNPNPDNLKIKKEDTSKLIHLGDLVSFNDLAKIKGAKSYDFELPESIRENANIIDEKLEGIKICDPAIGSGAFPVGMMSEIVKARDVLTNYIDDKKNRTIYNFKCHAIQESIYGVDIDPSAVDIAKLRLWLSLVVDEEEYKTIKPLPNLDYKIMQGNSLLEEYGGIKLFDEKLLGLPINYEQERIENLKRRREELEKQILKYYKDNPELSKHQKIERPVKLYQLEEELKKVKASLNLELYKSDSPNMDLFKGKKRELIWQKLNTLHKELFNTYQREEKTKVKNDIERLEWDLIEATLKDQGKEYLIPKINQFKKSNTRPFFLWKLHFAEVFQEKGGFDVVIGNPPYGLLNKKQNKSTGHIISSEEIIIYKNTKEFKPALGGMVNVFRLFIVKSINIIRQKGFFSEIFPLAFIGDISASQLRKWILNNYQIIGIEAFPERDNEKTRVFENVKMSVCILNLFKEMGSNKFFVRINWDKYIDESNEMTFINKNDIALIDNTHFTIPLLREKDLCLLKKVYSISKILSSLAHCYTGEIDITLGKKYITDNPNDSILIKGAIIDCYLIRKKMSQGEIKYLNSKLYLKENHGVKSLHHRMKRIVMQGITGINERIRLKMMIIDQGIFCANSVNYLIFKNRNVILKYYLALLNSSLLNYIFKLNSTNSNVNGYEIDNLPIISTNNSNQNPFIELVDKILAITKDDDYLNNSTKQAKVKEYEHQIDQMVYDLYGLTKEEIAIVEGKTNKNS